MTTCINTIFNKESINTALFGIKLPVNVEKKRPVAVAIISLIIFRRILLTLQHIARATFGVFAPLHKLEENYLEGEKCTTSYLTKAKLWFKDIGCILIFPFLGIKNTIEVVKLICISK